LRQGFVHVFFLQNAPKPAAGTRPDGARRARRKRMGIKGGEGMDGG